MTASDAQGNGNPPLTASEVQEIAGPLEDDRVALIIATGASEADLIAAVEWLAEDDAMGRERHAFTHGVVNQLCDILSAGEPQPGDER